jgi:glycerate kinase
MKMSKDKEANLISFKVVLTSSNQIVTELSMLPEEEIDKVFKIHHENETVRTILKVGQRKLATLHNYFQSELNIK